MRVKIKVLSGKRQSEFEITIKEAGMVQPVEAAGTRSICTLLDKTDWDAALSRLKELGVKVRRHKGRPVVNVEEVKEASRIWFKKHSKDKTPRKPPDKPRCQSGKFVSGL